MTHRADEYYSAYDSDPSRPLLDDQAADLSLGSHLQEAFAAGFAQTRVAGPDAATAAGWALCVFVLIFLVGLGSALTGIDLPGFTSVQLVVVLAIAATAGLVRRYMQHLLWRRDRAEALVGRRSEADFSGAQLRAWFVGFPYLDEYLGALPEDVVAHDEADYVDAVALVEVASGSMIPDEAVRYSGQHLSWNELAALCNRHQLRKMPRTGSPPLRVW